MIFDDPQFFLNNFPPPHHFERVVGGGMGGVKRQGAATFKLSQRPSLDLMLTYSISRIDDTAYIVYHVAKVFTYWVAVKALCQDFPRRNMYILDNQIVSTKFELHKRASIEDIEHYMAIYLLSKGDDVSA